MSSKDTPPNRIILYNIREEYPRRAGEDDNRLIRERGKWRVYEAERELITVGSMNGCQDFEDDED